MKRRTKDDQPVPQMGSPPITKPTLSVGRSRVVMATATEPGASKMVSVEDAQSSSIKRRKVSTPTVKPVAVLASLKGDTAGKVVSISETGVRPSIPNVVGPRIIAATSPGSAPVVATPNNNAVGSSSTSLARIGTELAPTTSEGLPQDGTILPKRGRPKKNVLGLPPPPAPPATMPTAKAPADPVPATPLGGHKCGECGKKYDSEDHLKEHSKTHEAPRPFGCNFCHKTFSSRGTLRAHEYAHGAALPYKCEAKGCNKSYAKKESLVNHMRLHSGERPYVCADCNKSYAKSELLRLHRMIHTGEKPHKCASCSRSFRLAASFRNHMRVHTGERPFKCSYCDYHFVEQSARRKHEKRIHPNGMAQPPPKPPSATTIKKSKQVPHEVLRKCDDCGLLQYKPARGRPVQNSCRCYRPKKAAKRKTAGVLEDAPGTSASAAADKSTGGTATAAAAAARTNAASAAPVVIIPMSQ